MNCRAREVRTSDQLGRKEKNPESMIVQKKKKKKKFMRIYEWKERKEEESSLFSVPLPESA